MKKQVKWVESINEHMYLNFIFIAKLFEDIKIMHFLNSEKNLKRANF